MTAAWCISDDPGIKFLIGGIFCHGTGNDIRTGSLTIQADGISTDCMLVTMCHQTLTDYQLGTCCQFCLRITLRRIHTFDLDHFHLHVASFFHIHFRARIQDTFSFSVTCTIMFFHIFYFCIFLDEETVDTIMLCILIPTVVDTTASYNNHVTAFSDMEIVINHLFHAALAQYNRNVYTLVYRTRFDIDVDTADICLGYNINICRCISGCHLTVCTDVVSSLRNSMQISDFRQKSFLNLIHHIYLILVLSYIFIDWLNFN